MIKTDDWFYKTAWYLLRFLGWLLFRLEFRGVGNLPSEGAFIVAPNHFSYLEPPLVGVGIPRKLHSFGKAELWKNRWLGRLFDRVGGIPVRRGTPDTKAIRTAIQFLHAGEPVMIFPEGTRNPGDHLLPANPGVALLARQTGAPVIPVGVIGTEKAWPRTRKFPRLAKVIVIFGQPFTFEEVTKGVPEKDARDFFSAYVMDRIADLLCQHGLPIECRAEEAKKQPVNS